MAKALKKKQTTKPAKQSTKKRLVTADDLSRLQMVSDPQISPDGKEILFTKTHTAPKNKKTSNLWRVPCDGGRPRQFTSSGKDRGGRFSPDGNSIVFASGRNPQSQQLHIIDRHGGEAKELTSFSQGSIHGYVFSPDSRLLAVSFRETDPHFTKAAEAKRKKKGLSDPPWVIDDWWYRLDGDGYFGAQRFAVYIVEIETGKHRRLYDKDTMGWTEYDFSPNSRELLIATNRHKQAMVRRDAAELVRVNVASGKITPVRGVPSGPKHAPKWSPDGKTIAWAGLISTVPGWGAENDSLFVMNLATKKIRNLTSKHDYCTSTGTLSDTEEIEFGTNFHYIENGKRILITIGFHGQNQIGCAKTNSGSVELLTSGRCGYGMGNSSHDGTRVALMWGDATHPSEIAVGILTKDGLEKRTLTNFNGPLLKELKLSKPKPKWIRSADGTRVQLWAMDPTGGPKRKKAPAVLEVHGGPHAQYGEVFFHEFQLLAANGYRVFYANPRGSKGYGEAFTTSIEGRWGHHDWQDITAVADHMESRNDVDTQAMAIMGGSYGGYMTLWAIGHTNRFAAAITDRCVSNMVTMGGNSDFIDAPDHYFPGNFWDNIDARWDQSPMKHIGNAKTPTMIIHSEGDLRCNIEQAEQVFSALKLLKVPTRFVRYPRSTSHGMSRDGPMDLREHRLEQILWWFKRHLQKRR
ncbi:MAG: S9 family peptidase [Phycisphaerales bacterium]|nr:S9 family peptidase [Phycisphaerales bacterium]